MSSSEAEAAVASKGVTVVEDAAKRHAKLFAEFPEFEVKKVSRMEREKKELANRSLVYGEIPFETVDAIFQLMRTQFGVLLDKGGNFYDIGSGCGKVVMAAALLHDFSKCCGIEVLDGLHSVALKVLDRWRFEMLDSLPATKVDVDVGFVKGDAVKRPDIWRDATLVFCNSTCFSDSLIQAISTEADQLAVGSYFVTVTKPLQSTRSKRADLATAAAHPVVLVSCCGENISRSIKPNGDTTRLELERLDVASLLWRPLFISDYYQRTREEDAAHSGIFYSRDCSKTGCSDPTEYLYRPNSFKFQRSFVLCHEPEAVDPCCAVHRYRINTSRMQFPDRHCNHEFRFERIVLSDHKLPATKS
ncbi:hypothetical protein PC115_g10583 [Phytophthora cactorum]|uniref:Histone-lysine N-methyltransferase, H3 lysine-79 specific n=1 Tax=Phytophthora cactorum TaxID=29920 RepID=A0A8T1CAJ0_9STRA|nr:hypothetical protein PC115_g10583 [Phytophthora cactorum]KAG3082337.1 hypothetical protein PC122_g10964 [Phytophthora cactorum]